MKKILLISFLGIILFACSSLNIGKNKMRYFDENNMELSKSKFKRIRSTNEFLDVPGDSINHKKLVEREEHGKIKNRALLESILEKEINQEINSNKPIVIIYYPGKDRCNSSGTGTKESTSPWFDQLEDGVNQIAKTKPIYIYKDYKGLEEYNGMVNWHKDPKGIVEKLFFLYHYPCFSFVVISKEGNYISYFGEFGKVSVWKATQLMNK